MAGGGSRRRGGNSSARRPPAATPATSTCGSPLLGDLRATASQTGRAARPYWAVTRAVRLSGPAAGARVRERHGPRLVVCLVATEVPMPNVLLVDDDEDTRTLVLESLKRRGISANMVASGQECLDWVRD